MTQDIARLRELIKRTHERLAGVSIDRMEGDNLAIVLCSHFDDGEGDNDENGWSEAATAGYDETIQAIRAHYQPVFDALLSQLEAATAQNEELKQEAELFDADHADQNRMVDRIADLIGLPHDQELDTTAFELWFSAQSAQLEAATARVGVLEEALEPFAKLAGPINGEADRPTYIESIEGKDGTGELYLGTHFGTERYLTMWAEDFTAARAVLARYQFAENANCTALARSGESGE